MQPMLKKRLSVTVSLVFLLVLFVNPAPARASILSDLTDGVATFVQFLISSVSGARDTFCGAYAVDGAGGNSAAFDLGRQICGGTKASSSFSFPPISSFFLMPSFSLPSALTLPPDSAASSSAAQNPAPVQPQAASSASAGLPGGLSGGTSQTGTALDDGQIIYWTNIARADNGGLSALSENSTLDKIASIRVADMFAKQYFDHYSPTGDNVSKEADTNGYSYITIGENIAEGNFGGSHGLVTAWMNSPGHRANILNTKYTEIGVAAEEGTYQGNRVWIAGQVFGEPASACPSPDAALKSTIASDQSQATSLDAQITAVKTQMNADSGDTSAYNADVATYNGLADQYNTLVTTLKSLVATYNVQVAAFNACIKQ
ncbi:MAG: CAP domain-containing protein [Patescibacteria group bacterium]|nr:CAP domain-containing protein [Patescibacteria group bacterium]MDE1945853.1 CAP domain-containing protein [Patescibacteria group bacterium]